MIQINKNTVTFNNQRWYSISDHILYPSITTILGCTEQQEKIDSLNAWKNAIGIDEANRITEFSR